MKPKKPGMFVAIIEGKDTHFYADQDANSFSSDSVRAMAEKIVRESGIKTPRCSPQTIRVRIDKIGIRDGEMDRTMFCGYDIRPPLTAMTDDDFNKAQNSLLSEIPLEFRSVLGTMAWESGHSSGYEEVISCLKDLVSDFRPAIEAYGNNLKCRDLRRDPTS